MLVRHGESVWNASNRFAGWVDVDLTPRGVEDARQAGRTLARAGFALDACHTSLLKRAHRTLWHLLDELDCTWLPVAASWRLNERHYGALQGLNREEAAAVHGAEQVRRWRRCADARPPALDAEASARERADRRYAGLAASDFPTGESLQDTADRVQPYWRDTLAPALRAGHKLLVVAHGNSIRALVTHAERSPRGEFEPGEIPHGEPVVYEFDADLNVTAKLQLARAVPRPAGGSPTAAQSK